MVYFVAIVRVLLGVTFLFSAYTKAVAPGFFEITLIDQGLAVTRNFAAHMTRFIIGMEFSIGLLMFADASVIMSLCFATSIAE